MRILFAAVPSAGHVLPMLPLAGAARAAGHACSVMTGAELAPLVAPVPVIAVGPPQADLMAEAARRSGGPVERPGAAAIEYFVGTRLDATFDDALGCACSFAPDLIVADAFDAVGPMVAAALGVPWAAHAISAGPAPALQEMMGDAVRAAGQRLGQSRSDPVALVDPVPGFFGDPVLAGGPDRIAIHPVVHDRPEVTWSAPAATGRPRVLVTFGTTVHDEAALQEMVVSLLAVDVDVVVTGGATLLDPDIDRERVHAVDFVPLARLLPEVDLVVSAAGTGTILASLASALPMVLRPFIADQHRNAERAAAIGVALSVSEPGEVGAAAASALSSASLRSAAERAAEEVASMPSPEEALGTLLAHLA